MGEGTANSDCPLGQTMCQVSSAFRPGGLEEINRGGGEVTAYCPKKKPAVRLLEKSHNGQTELSKWSLRKNEAKSTLRVRVKKAPARQDRPKKHPQDVTKKHPQDNAEKHLYIMYQ
jgi:hypothetical protein